ncbi:peptidyl-prolyl cis-trans isomerase B [Aplysia californica]|uniref:Peptidyl-prolyl cis-trans isomerase n=1 Tax=Aplysia californica TaxID=6500 RepID=A0ABM0ZZT9_APLCA|nr:peptidyl-prolyl cis-trans isomerase B [Aplysia californica]
MATYALLLPVAYFLLTGALAEKNATAEEKDINKFDVKKVNYTDGKRVYGGKEREAPPEKLTVTDEIWLTFQIDNYFEKGKHYQGKVTIACFGELTPVTCLNFISLAKGYRKGRGKMTYKGTKVQKIIRDFMIQMGDVETKYTKGDSIFGSSFNDEDFSISHSHAGWVGMANFGPDTNGSQFYILLRSARWLDGKHVIFGKVLEGMDVLQTIALEETNRQSLPFRTVSIKDCGAIPLSSHYTLTSEDFNTNEDIRTK